MHKHFVNWDLYMKNVYMFCKLEGVEKDVCEDIYTFFKLEFVCKICKNVL